MNKIRQCKVSSFGWALPSKQITFSNHKRYRISGDETHMSLTLKACNEALNRNNISKDDIDCIVFASSSGFQIIPCSASLIHEQLQLNSHVPALDINTTCTSFITAVDIMSYLIDGGRYNNVLIVTSEVPSKALNPKQRESYELFSDAAVAMVLSSSNNNQKGVISSVQHTFSQGAHWTEIRGGLSLLPPQQYSDELGDDYLFDMNGLKILKFSARYVPNIFNQFLQDSSLSIDDVDMIIPHQASRALDMMMSRLGITEDKYPNLVSEYGNMVAASVPFIFSKMLEANQLKEGQKIILCGTAAGLSVNILALNL